MCYCPSVKKPISATFFKRSVSLLFIVCIVNLFVLLSNLYILAPYSPKPVMAATSSLTHRVDWSAGKTDGAEYDSKEGDLKLNPDGTWGPLVWHTPHYYLTYGSTSASDGDYIYVLIGRTMEFVRYLPNENRWETLTDSPYFVDGGSDMVVLGNYVYAMFGNYTKHFSRYSIAENTWEDLTNLPDFSVAGGTIATDGTDIFVLRGGSGDFYKYTIATDSWAPLTAIPVNANAGADLVYSGGYLFTPVGGGSTTFYRYTISSDTWTTRTVLPGSVSNEHDIAINGDYIYVMQNNTNTVFYRYSITGNSWTTRAALPQAARYGMVVYVSSESQLFLFRGNGTYDFWKFDDANNLFLGPKDLPTAAGTGADLIYSGGYVYYHRGNGASNFYRYQVSNDSWATLDSSPNTLNDDTKMVLANGIIYVARGSSTNTFYSYTIGGTWATLTNAPATLGNGSSLVYPGSGDYIYATRGLSTRSFYRYSISGNSWDDASVTDLPDNTEASYGARLLWDGTNIYYLSGYQTNSLMRYSIGGNSWTEVTTLPFAPFYGTDAAYYNGKIYAMAGYYKPDFWEYTIATNTWRLLPYIQENYVYELGPYNGASLESDGTGNFYMNQGAGFGYFHKFTASSYNYPVSGTWTSDYIDLTYVADWNSLTASTTTPGDSSVSLQTRTSADMLTWSSWQSLSGTSIQSAVNRYIQVKATLTATTDRTQTPTVHSLTIDYDADTTAPTNPVTFTGTSQQVGGVSLTSGSTYSHNNPYFTWTAGSDSGSGLAGYYVYFGTNVSADPVTAGTYQTSATYTVKVPMSTGTYYLRVSAKDNAGNSSVGTTGFTYGYQGITAGAVTATSTADFSTGTLTNVSATGDVLMLASKAGFWVEQRIATTPNTINYGSGMAYVATTGILYVTRGTGTNTFYSYNVATDTWGTLANAPSTITYGGDLVEGPTGYLYGIPGNNTTTFWIYEIASNTWSDGSADDAPVTFYNGSSLVYDGSRYIYALRGNGDDAFLRYDTSMDTWTTLTSTDFGAPVTTPNNTVSYGGDLAFDGSNTIYAIQGNTYTGFSSYNISEGTWTVLDNVPIGPYYDAQLEYDSITNALYLIGGWDTPYVFKYDLAQGEWERLADGPYQYLYGVNARFISGEMFITRGRGTSNVYKYNPAKNTWYVPTIGLFGNTFWTNDYYSFSYGADMVKGDGNYYYMVRGNYDNLFVRYDPTTAEAVQLADAPLGFYTGGALAYDSTNQKIYAVASSYTRKFMVYDIASDAWSEITTDPPPYDSNQGTRLVYDGSRYIYWTRSGSTTDFQRYDTQGTAGSRWESRAAVSGTVGAGSDMVYKGGYIYLLRGNGLANFYQYNPGSNSWSGLTSISATVNTDGFIVDGGGDLLYACRGTNTATCYSYSISGNSWSAIANAPAQINNGGTAASDGTGKVYAIAGGGTNTYASGLYTYIMQTSSTSFEEEGSYISASYDLTQAYKYANLALTYATATNTTLTVYTRTSEDNSVWGSWSEANELSYSGTAYTYKINSTPNRYIQVRFDMTSGDSIYSGTVSDYTINYYSDTTAPTNPSSLTSLSASSGGTSITTGNWYNYTAPYFNWPDYDEAGGSTDTSTGSGVLGYYVYFGTSAAADPETLGESVVVSEYAASSLVSGNTYYLRIKAVDNAGNVNSTTWAPFTYSYDSAGPSAPGDGTADPSGYSATDSFDFTWDASTDTGSGIASYCYKTGATDGTYATDQCITELTVADIPSYKSGANIFYVRALDTAGNYSSYATVNYYYSSDSPSPPTDLAVTPSTNTENSFAFSWDDPETYFGSAVNIIYHYSVNALPTENSTTATVLQSLTAGPYATLPGENTFYVVAEDEAGNIDWDQYTSITFTANTAAPGIPTNADIADVSVKSTSSWKLAVSWEEPADVGAGVATYKIYRSTDNSTFTERASTAGISYVDTGLSQVTYYYKVKACDSTNNCGAFSSTVSLYPDGKFTVAAPLVGDPAVSNITTKKATISWTTSRTADSKVAYGLGSDNYFDEEIGSSDQETEHVVTLTNLSPGKQYYYVAKWTDEDGNLGTSDEFTFDTTDAPSAKEVSAINVGLDQATIQFTSTNASKAKIYYGKTADFGSIKEISVSADEATYTVQLTNLTDGTKYYYRVDLLDVEDEDYAGDVYSFETLPRPKIDTASVQQVKGTAAPTVYVTWTTNTEVTSVVTYYPASNPGAALDSVKLDLEKGKHRMLIEGLLPKMEYVVVVSGKDKAGNEAKSEPIQFVTSHDTRAPLISNLKVEGNIISVGGSEGQKIAQLVVSWNSDELATSQIEYGEGSGTAYAQKTQEDSNMTFNHLVVITGLTPSKVYHLRTLSKDSAGNETKSIDTVTITPKATDNALDLVVSNLGQVFGFLNGKK